MCGHGASSAFPPSFLPASVAYPFPSREWLPASRTRTRLKVSYPALYAGAERHVGARHAGKPLRPHGDRQGQDGPLEPVAPAAVKHSAAGQAEQALVARLRVTALAEDEGSEGRSTQR